MIKIVLAAVALSMITACAHDFDRHGRYRTCYDLNLDGRCDHRDRDRDRDHDGRHDRRY